MKVIRWSGHVHDLHIAVLMLPRYLLLVREMVRMVITQLQETLDTRRRMFGTLTIIAVRQ